ncbi:MAG TPA: hypothetical protein VIW70_00570 [Rubrivivax sp.]
MTETAVDASLSRDARKRNLVLASHLARGQVVLAFDQIGQRADSAARVIARAHAALANPAVWAAGSAAGALLFGIVLRRARWLSLLRWGFLAWRVMLPTLQGARRRGRDSRFGD